MKLDELEALAREATPGPWEFTRWTDESWRVMGLSFHGVRNYSVADVIDGDGDHAQNEANARLIAAANPQAILKLCAVVRAASLTPDELDFVLTELKGHGSRDLELECPGCTAYRKLSALRTALSDIGAKE